MVAAAATTSRGTYRQKEENEGGRGTGGYFTQKVSRVQGVLHPAVPLRVLLTLRCVYFLGEGI